MKPLVTFLFLILMQLFSGQLAAAEVTSKMPSIDPVSSSYLIKLTLALVFILLLIFGLAWMMKKMQLTQHSQNDLIKIVSAISVGQRDRIALIQVGDEQVLLGLTPGRIEKLHTLKSIVNTDLKSVDNQSFGEKFNQLLNRDNSKNRDSSHVD